MPHVGTERMNAWRRELADAQDEIESLTHQLSERTEYEKAYKEECQASITELIAEHKRQLSERDEEIARLRREPECACEEYWPGQGHPSECPTQAALHRTLWELTEAGYDIYPIKGGAFDVFGPYTDEKIGLFPTLAEAVTAAQEHREKEGE